MDVLYTVYLVCYSNILFERTTLFSHFEISSEWVMGKLVDRSTWRLFLLNSFLDTKWFQADEMLYG